MTRLQDTARSTGSSGASGSPRSSGPSSSNNGGRSPVTLAAAAAAAARRTMSPSSGPGSKSAWGENHINATSGRSEGKTSPEATGQSKSPTSASIPGPTRAPTSASRLASAGTAKILEKYTRMRKMGIPDGAIRHKMKQDGVEAANIATFFSSSAAPMERTELPVAGRAPAAALIGEDAIKSREDLKTYFKMKKLGLPDGAIRQKMQKDGMSGADIAAFFGERPPAAAAVSSKTNSNVNNRDDMKKYFKMKKMGLPEGAVRQKMQTDGMSAADIAAFFGESPPAAAAPPKTNSDLKNREDMKKYFKMKKMGLPDGAIRQKMKQDGISASDAAAFFGEAPPANSSKNGVHIPRIDLSALRAKQTARRAEMETAGGAMSKYFKMQSMGIPMGAIRMRMKADSIDAADIAAFCGDMPAGGPPGRPATLAEQKSQQARLKLKKLHWKKLDSTRAQKSVWGQSMSQQTTRSDSARDKDMDELAKHFGQKIGKGKKDGKRGGRGSSLGAGAAGESKAPKRLLDGKRARNIEIGLAQFRAFKQYEDIGECIESLDESRISADRLETLLGISPTPQEMQMFEGHLKRGTDLSALGAAEKFHVAATKVARFREKVRAFLFKSHFSDLVEQLEDQGKTLCKAIDQITMSKKLTRVLETVLSVGNLMNQGTHAGDAVGITLDSLLKLTSTKSHDNKMTVLDYVVQTMLKSKEKRAHTSFPEELSQLRNATKCAPKVLPPLVSNTPRICRH